MFNEHSLDQLRSSLVFIDRFIATSWPLGRRTAGRSVEGRLAREIWIAVDVEVEIGIFILLKTAWKRVEAVFVGGFQEVKRTLLEFTVRHGHQRPPPKQKLFSERNPSG